jgi:hypothetical protein
MGSVSIGVRGLRATDQAVVQMADHGHVLEYEVVLLVSLQARRTLVRAEVSVMGVSEGHRYFRAGFAGRY